jgi:hypothetical protein
VLLAVTLSSAPLTAQERSQARLILTVNAGVVFGGSLWSLPEQPVATIGVAGSFDTLSITRRLTSGLAAGLTASLFTSKHLGFTFEAIYLGQNIDDDCTVVTELDPRQRNSQVCRSITAKETSAATSGFYVGGVYRFTPAGSIMPFIRLQGGISIRGSSVIEVSGVFIDEFGNVQDRVVIQDTEGATIAPSLGIAAGMVIPISPGYQVMLEIRDHIIRMQRVTGPALMGQPPPTEGFYDHAVAVTVGFSIVLEKKRGRRY